MSAHSSPLIIPHPLKPGEMVGIASPASPYSPSLLRCGIALLKEWGYRPVLGRPLHHGKGYLAGSDQERAAELNDLLTDPEIKAVLCSRGGYGTMRILDALDYGRIKKHPKIVMGFSDVTALLSALYVRTGLLTFHGPMVTTLPSLSPTSLKSVRKVLSGPFPQRIPLRKGTTPRPAGGRGRLIGGNLTLLCHLIGTPYEPPWEGAILFLEDCGEALYRIDRLFQHLRLRKVWEKVSAVILGTFTGPGGKRVPESFLRSLLEGVGVPVWTNLPVGHGRHNIPLPYGAPVFLEERQGLLIVQV